MLCCASHGTMSSRRTSYFVVKLDKIEDARIYPRTSDTWRTAFTVRTPWRIPSLHFHQAFLFTRRCGGHEVVWISERAGNFTESRNGSLGRVCGAACTSSPPDCSSVRLRVKGCWEGHIYSRSTRGTCPASKRVVLYGSCMYLIDN